MEGVLRMPPEDKQGKQSIELMVSKVLDVGTVDRAKYLLPKAWLTLELLRDYVHLRPKTNTIFCADFWSLVYSRRHCLGVWEYVTDCSGRHESGVSTDTTSSPFWVGVRLRTSHLHQTPLWDSAFGLVWVLS